MTNFLRALALATFIGAASFAFAAATTEQSNPEIDSLYSTPGQTLRAPASAMPEDLAKDFAVVGPERSPASVKKAIGKPVAKAPVRRSRLPATVSDGFELRVQYNKLTSTFWVVKRDEHYDLLFANSSGSSSSVGLSQDDFKRLFSLANSFRTKENDIRKCKDSSIQMHVVAGKQPERTVTTCVLAKTKEAEGLRNLSQSLALAVR